MKMLRGKHHYKSYKELCAALGIEPAPRGLQREAQKGNIQKTYQITVQPNNSIDLLRIPVKATGDKSGLLMGGRWTWGLICFIRTLVSTS